MELMSETYDLIVSEDAKDDISEYIDYITFTCDAPETGKKHYLGLRAALKKIQKYPEINPIRNTASLQQYGPNVRRVNFKKMAIIYTINGDIVFIRRVIASSLITD